MKLLLLPLFLFFLITGQSQSVFKISKNDIAIMSIEVGAGYMQGWREETLYHPNELFKHFPNLSRSFWDNRISWKNATKFDANHVLKGGIVASQLVAIVIKTGDLKEYPKRKRLLKILVDLGKYYFSYQLGFFLSYNLTHQNKL